MKVTISGTMAKDKKPDSGLDEIGDKVNANRLQRVAVVGIVEYHGHHEVVGQPETVSVRFCAIEPLDGKDDTLARTLLDRARRGRGLGSAELTLFEVDPHAAGQAAGPWPGDTDFIGPGGADKASGPEPESKPKARRRASTLKSVASLPPETTPETAPETNPETVE